MDLQLRQGLITIHNEWVKDHYRLTKTADTVAEEENSERAALYRAKAFLCKEHAQHLKDLLGKTSMLDSFEQPAASS